MRYEIRCGAPAAPDVCLAWWCNDLLLPLFWFADPRTPGCSPGDRGWDCGWEYSEVESRKSDQNQHLEGGRVFGGSIRWEYILFLEFVFPATLLEHVGLLVGPSCFGCNGRSFPQAKCYPPSVE